MIRTFALSLLLAAAAGLGACEKQTAVGLSGEKLTIYKPSDEHIQQGETGEVDVRVNRSKFDGPLTVAISDLPAGIHVTNTSMTIPSDDSKLTLNLSADATATVVKDQVVNVRVTSANGITASESFKITVAAR